MNTDSPHRRHHRLLLGVAFASGIAALMHQTVWIRALIDILGAGTGTFSRVLGTCFAGLALGSMLAGPFARRFSHPGLAAAAAELGIGLCTLPLWLFHPQTTFSPDSSQRFSEHDILTCLVFIGIPATWSGMTIPLFARLFVGPDARGGRPFTLLYSWNTLGAMAGAMGTVLVAFPWLGLRGTGWFAAALNLVAGAVLWFAVRGSKTRAASPPGHNIDSPPPGTQAVEPSVQPSPVPWPAWVGAWVAFASGALVIASEVILQHHVAQICVNSITSAASVLTLVLAGLSAGAFLAGRPRVQAINPTSALLLACIGTSLTLVWEPIALLWLRRGLNPIDYALPPLAYWIRLLFTQGLAILPMAVAAGFVLPLTLSRTRADASGRLLALNGIGGLLGAEFTARILCPQLGLWGSMLCLAGAYLFVAAVVGVAARSRIPAGIHVAAGLALLTVGFAWGSHERWPVVRLAPGEVVVDSAVDREGSVVVVRQGDADWRIVMNNTYTLGGSLAAFPQERQGLLPALLHGQPRRAALLGVATGSTLAGLAAMPGIESIDAFELCPRVLSYARDHFSRFNRNVLEDPRVHPFVGDARHGLAIRPDQYDLVVGDLFLPWRNGESRMFSLEHFRAVSRALRPSGLFCQWLPLYQLTRPQFDCIVRTFQQVFPSAFLIRGDFYTELPIVGLVGGPSLDRLDWERIGLNTDLVRSSGSSLDPMLRHAAGVAMLLIGPAQLPQRPDQPAAPLPPPINTLTDAWLEWDSARQVVGLRTPWFVGIPLAEELQTRHRVGRGLLPASVRAAHDAGQFFLTLEIAAFLKLAAYDNLRAQLWDRLPAELSQDTGADWNSWPMRLKPFIHFPHPTRGLIPASPPRR